ncbi:site-specific integrase [Sphingobium cupriresistens]|uniref:Integrase n=1 Tax=Sphingobium cupriresistens LL01 TaxID=1420583 RepID=A0A0J7XVJ5_9SPHN|nr:site-specific integrase [Sphingobium cupriresistens]KMS55761.1 integrase [Sphingobium cupriresistens LL01]
MPKQKLDASFCLLAACETGKRKIDYYDTSITGFVLEVRPNGGKTYYLRYQDDHGRQKQHKIAAYADISFDKAKKEAQRLRSQVVLGGDPAATKEQKKAIPLYSTLADQHLAHAKTYQRSYDTTAMYVNRHIVPKWGKHRLTDITQQGVAQWLADKAGEGLAPATVEKMRVILGRSFELAKQWGMAGSDKNPTRGIPRKPINNARDRYLNAAEAKRLMTAVEASRNPQLKFIVGLLLLTGARVSELLNAKWKHINLDRRVWLIPTSKTGKPRHVPLSKPAIDILSAVPRFDKCDYVLPNPETLKPFVSIKHGWQTARDEAKLPDLRIHDLRHSAASFMINAGVDLFAVGRVLGHADHKSTMRYSHLANDTLMAAVEAGARKMKGVGNGI